MSKSGSPYRNPHYKANRGVDEAEPRRRIHGFPRLPSGVLCECGAEWQPVCPTKGCPANAPLHDLPDSIAAAIRRERRGRPHERGDRERPLGRVG